MYIMELVDAGAGGTPFERQEFLGTVGSWPQRFNGLRRDIENLTQGAQGGETTTIHLSPVRVEQQPSWAASRRSAALGSSGKTRFPESVFY
jgi:hypothetical protein